MQSSNFNLFRGSLVKYGADLYARLENETGQSVGWRNCGYVKVARTKARFEDYKRSVSIFNALGGQAAVIDPKRVRELWPLAETSDLVGAVWEPGSGRVDPTGLVMAYAKGARSLGANFIETCGVTGILSSKNQVTGVSTTRGTITCDVVVNCAGLWARQIGLPRAFANLQGTLQDSVWTKFDQPGAKQLEQAFTQGGIT